jgi:hypothetical protein
MAVDVRCAPGVPKNVPDKPSYLCWAASTTINFFFFIYSKISVMILQKIQSVEKELLAAIMHATGSYQALQRLQSSVHDTSF